MTFINPAPQFWSFGLILRNQV